MRVVCRPDRAHAEHAGRRGRDRQLRDGARDGELRRRARDAGRVDCGDRGGRLRRAPARAQSGRAAAASGHRRRSLGTRARAGDGPGAAVRRLAVALPRARDARRALGGLPLPQCRLAQPPPRRDDHGHARLARHARRLGLVRRRALLPRLRGDLLRGRRRRHHIHPPRPLLRGTCKTPLGSGAAGASRARCQGRRAALRRRTGAPHSHRRASRRRSLRRPPGREDRHRRDRRGRPLRGRSGAADRGVDASREAPGRRRGRRCDQRRRAHRRAGDEGRRRHCPGADRSPRECRAGRQGTHPASGRSHFGDLRADRAGPLRRHARVLAARRRGRRRGIHGGGGRPDHRLPVCARPRHAHRVARRHGPRSAARHPDQGAGGAGIDPSGRHDRARQDGNGDNGPHAAASRDPRRRERP